MKMFIGVIFYIFTLLIDLAFTEYFTFFNILPYAIVLFLYFYTLIIQPEIALILAGFTGFVYDLFAPHWFGLHIITFTTFVFILILFKEKIFWERYSSLLVLFGGAFLTRLVLDIPYYSGFWKSILSIFTLALPGAIITSLAGFVVKFFIESYKRRRDEI